MVILGKKQLKITKYEASWVQNLGKNWWKLMAILLTLWIRNASDIISNWKLDNRKWKTAYRRVPVWRCRCRDAPTPVELSSGGMTAAARPSHCSLQRPWNNLHSAHWAYLLHTQHLHYIAQWACSGGKYVSIRILLKHKISVLTLFTVVVVHRCCCRTLLRRARDSPDSGELVPARWPRWSWELRRPLLSYIPNLWLTVQCSAPTILHHLQSVETSIQASDQTLVPVHFYSLQHNIKQSFFGGDCWKCLTFKKVCISLHHHNLWKEKF